MAWAPRMAIGGRTADSVDIVATADRRRSTQDRWSRGADVRAPAGLLTIDVGA